MLRAVLGRVEQGSSPPATDWYQSMPRYVQAAQREVSSRHEDYHLSCTSCLISSGIRFS